MNTERRSTRSANPWQALNHLLAARATDGAVVADADGLLLAAIGLPEERAERIAAEVAYFAAEPVVKTGSGIEVRLHAERLASDEMGALRNDATRILRAV